MSDEHDHSHHGHSHGHEHGHGHDHDHQHAPPAASKPPTPTPPGAEDDAGSEALSEALSSSFTIIKVVMVIFVFVFPFTGVFRVKEGQRAVILHWGKPVGTGNAALLGPGLHWAYPKPIDEVRVIRYAQLQQVKSTVGWFNTTPEREAMDDEAQVGPSLNPAVDGYAITGDGNIIHTRATLTYRIEDPIQYEFGFTSAATAVQDALNNALLYAAARFKVDDVLTREITRFQDTVTARVTELAQRQNLGIVVENCQVESRPPRYLKTAFDSVLTALSARDKNRNDALKYQNEQLGLAASAAASRTNAAQAERVELVQSVSAEAQYFTDVLPHFDATFANILLSERIGRVLTNVEDKVYLPERADGKTRELRLQLSREPQKAAN